MGWTACSAKCRCRQVYEHDFSFRADSKKKGCPVATFGINNSINAAQYAARILALNDVNIRMRLTKYLAGQTESVIKDANEMSKLGFEEYHSSM